MRQQWATSCSRLTWQEWAQLNQLSLTVIVRWNSVIINQQPRLPTTMMDLSLCMPAIQIALAQVQTKNQCPVFFLVCLSSLKNPKEKETESCFFCFPTSVRKIRFAPNLQVWKHEKACIHGIYNLKTKISTGSAWVTFNISLKCCAVQIQALARSCRQAQSLLCTFLVASHISKYFMLSVKITLEGKPTSNNRVQLCSSSTRRSGSNNSLVGAHQTFGRTCSLPERKMQPQTV